MKRRQVLTSTAVCVGITGCLDNSRSSNSNTTENIREEGNETSEPNMTEENESMDSTKSKENGHISENSLKVNIWNRSNVKDSVYVRILDGKNVILDKKTTVIPDERVDIDTGIKEEGEYDVTASATNGRESNWTWHVSEWVLSTGSRLIIELHDDAVNILEEEGG